MLFRIFLCKFLNFTLILIFSIYFFELPATKIYRITQVYDTQILLKLKSFMINHNKINMRRKIMKKIILRIFLIIKHTFNASILNTSI